MRRFWRARQRRGQACCPFDGRRPPLLGAFAEGGPTLSTLCSWPASPVADGCGRPTRAAPGPGSAGPGARTGPGARSGTPSLGWPGRATRHAADRRSVANQIAHVRKLTRYFSFFLICLRSLSPKEQELIADATHAFRFFFTSVPSSHWLLCAIPKDRGGPWAHYS